MNRREALSTVGAIVSLVAAVLIVGPYVLIEGHSVLVSDYYTAGPVGLAVVAFFALLSSVVFLSAERGNVDPETIAGALVTIGLATFALAVLWHVSLDETVLFSFPAAYSWLENHPAAVVSATAAIPVVAGGYAWLVVR